MPGELRVQEAAAQVLDAGLLRDDSAFTPGRSVWTADTAQELVAAFVDEPDLGTGDFASKLRGQLRHCSPTAIQLAAELQYLTVLPLSDRKPAAKRERLREILSWSPQPVPVPDDLDAALDAGVFNGGMGFKVQGWKNFAILISLVAAWKRLDRPRQQALARDPWAFRDFVDSVPGPRPAAQRSALVYLAFPDVFEPIVSHDHKRRIRDAFVADIGGSTGDLDRDLLAIRETLERQAGKPIEFYLPPYGDRWRATKAADSGTTTPTRRAWLVRGSNVRGMDLVPTWLAQGWVSLAGSQLPEAQPGASREDLKPVVDEHYAHVSYNQRDQKLDEFHAFLSRMQPGDLVVTTSQGCLYLGELTGAATYETSADGRSNLRRPVHWSNADAGVDYGDLPATLAARLQSQHDVIDLTQQVAELELLLAVDAVDTSAAPELVLPDATAELATSLLVSREWLQECVELLRDRPQLIFYGPPGTGKTYLAQHLAWHLAGRDNTTLVQFHPAYSYEDFFEGFRPVPGEGGAIGFRLQPGPFRRVVDQAREHPESPYVLIIDEINRGNLAKIFGELYFLLEYRDQAIDLLYSSGDAQAFTLPPNVLVIGTMNTADRSIALVDAAMRRRFSFVALRPDEEPTRSMLSRWLEREGKPATNALLLERLNGLIDDPDFRIGPSYLMREAVYADGGLERVWRSAILPLLEEHHYGEGVDFAERYALSRLRSTLAPEPSAAPPRPAVDVEPDGEADGEPAGEP